MTQKTEDAQVSGKITDTKRTALISVTEKCNLNCKHCRSRNKNKELSLNDIKCISKKIKGKVNNINLTGGEPLLHSEIEKIVSFLSKNSFRVTLSTNGYFLNKKVATNLKNANLYGINISLDSISKEKHDFLRQKEGAYKKALESISIATSEGLNTRIASVVGKFNLHEIKELVNLAIKKNCSAISFRKIMPVGNIYKNELLNKVQDKIFLKEVYTYLSLLYPYFNIFVEHPLDVYFSGKIMNKKFNICGCSAAEGRLMEIKCNGDVVPCPAIDKVIGNIFNDSFEKIINNKTYSKMKNIKGSCSNCVINNICKGCRALAYYIYSDVSEEDSFCVFSDSNNILENLPNVKEDNFSEKEKNQVIEITEKFMKPIFKKSGIEWKRKLLKNDIYNLKPNEKLWIIKMKKKILGYCWFIEKKDYIYLKSILINKNNQNSGLGTLLLNRLILYAKSKNFKKLKASVQNANNKSKEFFKKNGFIEKGINKKGYKLSLKI